VSSLKHAVWRRARELRDWSSVLTRRACQAPLVDHAAYDGEPRVALVSVSFNTRELTKLMLLTLAEQPWARQLRRVLLVDNASSDGSFDFLTNLAAASRVSAVRNPGSTSHGVGLRFGLDWLEQADQALPSSQRCNLYWVVDTDILFLRPDSLPLLVEDLHRTQAALMGELQFDLGEPYAHPCSLLLRRDAYRDPRTLPFVDHGAPALWLERSLRRARLGLRDFPMRRDEHILHRGRGSIAEVNRLGLSHAYATVRDTAHFHGNPRGAQLWQEAEARHADRLGPDNEQRAIEFIARGLG
jgi:hypothetical protein